jgi:uncharacterized protein (DUF885 family)
MIVIPSLPVGAAIMTTRSTVPLFRVTLLGLCVLVAGTVHAQTAPASMSTPLSAGDRLRTLFNDVWERDLRESPESASNLGDTRFNDRWEDHSPQAFVNRHQEDEDSLQALKAIDHLALNDADRLNADIFEWQLTQRLARDAFHPEQRPLTHKIGPQLAQEITEVIAFHSLKAYQDYVLRLQRFPARMAQDMTQLKLGLASGNTPPRVLLERVPAQLARQVVDDPAKSPFYSPFVHVDAALRGPEFDALASQARAAIRDGIVPAFRQWQAYVTSVYLPGCRASIAARDLPNGLAYYNFLVRDQTTTTLTADQIHEMGLQEVSRIHADLEKAKDATGFKGDLADFFVWLRTDPRFFYTNGDDLFRAYQALAKRIDPELLRAFRVIPRQPYGVRPIPAVSAPDTTTAYYMPGATDGSRAGFYYVNLYRPETRPRWEMMPLTLHEAVPGHHFQFARSLELPEAPMFRRTAYFVAYSEGWALYAEQLGYDMGLYDDPFDRVGQLSYEMWRAVRLVVDTGMHAKGWSRQQAIDYFKSNVPKTELDIVNEVDRYIGDPGQALAYKIGQLKISGLRNQARTRLGDRFDVRDFNDEVLSVGSVPLDVLEKHMNEWIARH